MNTHTQYMSANQEHAHTIHECKSGHPPAAPAAPSSGIITTEIKKRLKSSRDVYVSEYQFR